MPLPFEAKGASPSDFTGRDGRRSRRANTRTVLLLAAIVVSASAGDAFSQAFVERVSPPSLVPGTSVRMVLYGTELEYATGLWSSLPSGALRAIPAGLNDAGHAQFDVLVSPQAPLGLYGMRVATASGLSNVHLVLVDDLVPQEELEGAPGGALGAAIQHLTLPAAVGGVCGASDADTYSFEAAAGVPLTFEVVGARLGQDFDPLITLYDPHGKPVASHDNDVGLAFDCRFEHVFPESGVYSIELRDTRFKGSDHTAYVLRIGRFPAARVALPSTVALSGTSALQVPQLGNEQFELDNPLGRASGGFYWSFKRPFDQASVWLPLEASPLATMVETEPNQSADAANIVDLPAAVHGQLGAASDRDQFAFDLKQGEPWSIRAECRAWGSPADLDLALADAAGKELSRTDTELLGEASFAFAAPADGRYFLSVRDLARRGGPEFTYRILVTRNEPTFGLDSLADNLAIPRNSWQPLPINVRRNQYDGPIALTLVGAPEGMKLRHGEVPSGLVEFNDAIEIDDNVPLGVYTVQVAGWSTIGDREVSVLAQTRPLIDRLPAGRGPHGEPFELREDQRRLPPSLTDRIAVLVLPPAPFDFALDEQTVILPRYEQAKFRIETSRSAGFASDIAFTARGGTLELLNLQPPRVRAEIPLAAPDQPAVVGLLRSGVNSELTRHRVTVTGTAALHGRRIALTRIFDLQLQVAYAPTVEPARVELSPGSTARIRLLANRLQPFAGDITLNPAPIAGLTLPTSVTIPAGQDSIEVELQAAPEMAPGSHAVAWTSMARVGGFFEQVAAGNLEVTVVQP